MSDPRRFGIVGPEERRISHDMLDMLWRLPPGQARVAFVLIGCHEAPTYDEMATALGVHVGTVYRQLRRIRDRHPDIFTALMTERRLQLAGGHERALERDEAHSRRWHRSQANRRYFYRFGR